MIGRTLSRRGASLEPGRAGTDLLISPYDRSLIHPPPCRPPKVPSPRREAAPSAACEAHFTIPPPSPSRSPSSIPGHSGGPANAIDASTRDPALVGAADGGGSDARVGRHLARSTPEQYELADYAQLQRRKSRRTNEKASAARRAEQRRRLDEQDEMKFSHSIQFNAVPDWSSHYIAYSNLKKL